MWLAVINTGMGGSYAKDEDMDAAINRVCKLFKSDWSTYYKLDGKEIKIAIIDHTPYEKLWWDECGFYSGKDRVPVHSVVTRTL